VTPILASIVGPPPATSIRARIASCHSGASCSALGSLVMKLPASSSVTSVRSTLHGKLAQIATMGCEYRSGVKMVTKDEYEAYKIKVLAGLKELLNSKGAPKQYRYGAGAVRWRYQASIPWSPSRMELLRKVAQLAGIDDEAFNFLSQKANNDPGMTWISSRRSSIGLIEREKRFPCRVFSNRFRQIDFLKHLASEHLKSFNKFADDAGSKAELDLLKRCSPHAAITTNFDTVREVSSRTYTMSNGCPMFWRSPSQGRTHGAR
jgi:hypothetical protein